MKKITLILLMMVTSVVLTSCFDSTSSDTKLNRPTDLTITPQSATEFLIEWTDNSKKEDGYKIERKFDNEEWQELAELPENTENYLDDISAAKDDWELISYKIYSFEGDDVSLPAEGYFVLNLPAPSNLTAEYSTQILLEWNDNSTGEDGFIIERKTQAESFLPIATTDTDVNYFIDSDIQTGQVYYYRVCSFVGDVHSDYSNEVMISTQTNPISADFVADITSGNEPLTVQFTDLSTGNIVSWEWDFGNGITSNIQNPLVIFTEPGIYTVSLIVSDGQFTDMEIKEDYITVEDLGNLSLSEDFESDFPPNGWIKLNPDGGTGWELLENGTSPLPGWTAGQATSCPNGGNWQAYCTWTTGGSSSNDQWLVTPQITVQDGDILDFWMIYYESSYIDHVEILISTSVQDDVNAFTTVVDAIDFNSSSPDDWTEYSYTLTDFVSPGTSVYIAFREAVADNYNDGSAISIDNVKVGQLSRNVMAVHPRQKNSQPGNNTKAFQ
jgi:PKD repeat protein